MKILIIGGGDITEELLKVIDLRRNEVLVVDSDEARCKDLSSRYDVYVINRNATDVSLYMSEVQVSEVDAVLALTNKDEVNIFVLSVAKMYNVPIRVARVNDPRVAELILKLDLGTPITSPSLVASMIRNYLDSIREPKQLMEFDDFKLYLVSLSETDRAVNKMLKELELPHDIRVLLVFDGNKIYPPNEETRLGNGYQLIVLSRASDVSDVVKYLKG